MKLLGFAAASEKEAARSSVVKCLDVLDHLRVCDSSLQLSIQTLRKKVSRSNHVVPNGTRRGLRMTSNKSIKYPYALGD